MRTAIAAALVLAATLVQAAKLPPPMKFNLVQASCNGTPPGPCSPNFRFASGGVVMKPIRQPQPTCPKTGQPTDAPGATVQMRGVTKSGSPFSGSLKVDVWLKTTFGDDPNGNCELRNIQVGNIQSLLGTLTCKNGTCKGTAFPVACLPAQCGDTTIVSELGSVQVSGGLSFGPVLVYDDAGLPFATPGSVLAGARQP